MPAGAPLDAAVATLAGRRVAVLTGAGLSTDSGLPDYRGEGAPPRSPMTIQQFLASRDARRRYWAGSHLGWRRFGSVAPNVGHLALAALEAAGVVTGVATQNVDGLHERAGTRRVVTLHGTMHRVVCLVCGQVFARDAVADRISAANPWLDSLAVDADGGPSAGAEAGPRLNPDGDVTVTDASRVVLPRCTVCGGDLKPEVVFFGEFIPRGVFRLATSLVAASDALLVAGSSLVVNSGIRLLEQARRRGLPIVIVNRGTTRGDDRATVKLDAGTSETLTALARRLPHPGRPAAGGSSGGGGE